MVTSDHFVEPLVPSVWTSVDSIYGFKSQGGSIIACTLLSLALNSQAWTRSQFYTMVR